MTEKVACSRYQIDLSMVDPLVYHRSSTITVVAESLKIMRFQRCKSKAWRAACLFSSPTTSRRAMLNFSPPTSSSYFRSQFSLWPVCATPVHAYSTLKLFTLNTFSPCSLIQRLPCEMDLPEKLPFDKRDRPVYIRSFYACLFMNEIFTSVNCSIRIECWLYTLIKFLNILSRIW